MGYCNFRAGGSKSGGNRGAWEAKVNFLLANIEMLSIAVLVLVEVWGTRKSMQYLRDKFREEAGMESRAKEGPAEGQRRVGGVIILWKANRFQRGAMPLYPIDINTEGGRRNRGSGGHVMLEPKGWEHPLAVVGAYGPQLQEEKLAFADALHAHLALLDGHYVMAGDLQGVMSPNQLAKSRNLRTDELALAAMVGVGTPDDPDHRPVGRRLDVQVHDRDCTFTHRDPRGAHASIDHVIVGGSESEAWQPLHACFPNITTPMFVGRPFDHAFIVVEHNLPSVQALGPRRPVKINIHRLPERVREELERDINEISLQAAENDAEALDILGREIVKLVAQAHKANEDRPLRTPELRAPAKMHVQYQQGVLRSIDRRWTDSAFFIPGRSPLVSHGALKRLAHKYARQGWKKVRQACRNHAHGRLIFYAALARQEKSRITRAAERGEVAYESPAAMAQMLNEAWREQGRGRRGGIVNMSKINVATQGPSDRGATPPHTLLQDGAQVMQAMADYGASQNRASNARPDVVRALLEEFCPAWPELTDADGSPWRLANIFTFDEFERVWQAFADKACGLDGFQVNFLYLASKETRQLYHRLLLSCMQAGHFPKQWSDIVAVLIEKKEPMPHDIDQNRDIWLLAAGAKVVQKSLLWNGLEAVRERILPCAAGSVRGRSGTEHVLSQRLLIRQALDLRTDIYVLWIDLKKCFMSFSRDSSQVVQERLGVPQELRQALKALYSEVRGCYDSAYGMTPSFAILRGLIQGALESPDLSLQLLNVMAEIMELKVLGFRHFNGCGGGERTVGMLYVDDGANTLDQEEMVHRAAFVWDVWARLFDTEVNVKKFTKSVVSGVTHRPLQSDKYALRPVSATLARKVRLMPKAVGAAAEVIPQLPFDQPYPYLGMFISLDGKCDSHLRYVAGKLRGAMAHLAYSKACRRRKVKMINPFVLGYGIAHGVGLNLTFERADRELGVLARMPLRVTQSARSRVTSAPRWQLHAPDKLPESCNARARERRARGDRPAEVGKPPPLVCGLNLVHPFAAICAGKHLAFWSSFSSPLAHMRRSTHHAVALTLHQLGCRGEDPSTFDFARHVHALDMGHDVENWLWCVYVLSGERCGWKWTTEDGSAPPGSPLGYVAGEGLFGTRRRSAALWQGPLWQTGKRTTLRELMRLVDEVAHVCTADGRWLEDFGEARKRWGPAGLERTMKVQWDQLLRELVQVGAAPVAGFGGLSDRQLHEGQRTITSDSWASEPQEAPGSATEEGSGWEVSSLKNILTDGRFHEAEEYRACFAQWRGSDRPREPGVHPLAAPSRLENRGGPMRHVCWYNYKTKPEERKWQVKKAGGQGIRAPAPADAKNRLRMLRNRFYIDEEGLLQDNAPDENAPAVIRLWMEAQRVAVEAEITPNAAENAFILDRLLELEAAHEFTHAAATDGSVGWERDRESAMCGERQAGRAALLAGEEGNLVLGGAMPSVHEGFDTQSYDSELEAFSDVLCYVARAPRGKRRVVIVTDCLSGSQALWRFHTRSIRERAGCYADDRLAGLLVVEDECEVVAYVWLHSHVNITLSEGADTAANSARKGELAPSLTLARPHAVARIPGVKRGHATAMVQAIQAWVLREHLLPASTRTLKPTGRTWEAFLSHDVERSPYPSDAVLESMSDLQADRLGLQGDRRWAHAARHTYGYFLRNTACALCNDPRCRQSREDVLLRCQAVSNERMQVARALRDVADDVPAARVAARAVEGYDMRPHEELDAVRFLCGLPDAPGEWDEDCTKDVVLQRRVGRRVHGAVHVLVQRVLELNHSARCSPALTLETRQSWTNIATLGLFHRWTWMDLSRRVMRAWRGEVSANGPGRTRARAEVRHLKASMWQQEAAGLCQGIEEARAQQHRMRATVRAVVHPGTSPNLYASGLMLVQLWSQRHVEAVNRSREADTRSAVDTRWTPEVEERMLDYPQAREYELEDISFGDMAAGWKWRLTHLLACWRVHTARSFLARRDAGEGARVEQDPWRTAIRLQWSSFHKVAHESPIPLREVSGIIVETLKVQWEQLDGGRRRMVPASTASRRETHRILRARHAPGVLSMPWQWGGQRGPMLVEKSFEEAREALDAERHLMREEDWIAAAGKLEQARQACSDGVGLRKQMDAAMAQAQPVVCSVWCPIDAEALSAWALTQEARQIPTRKDGTSYGATGAALVQRLLDACQVKCGADGDRSVRWLLLTYRHSALGDWLVASGWVSFSRLYADGADPFRLPSRIRRIALGRFGWELDDAAAYMRIICVLVPDLRPHVAAYLSSKTRIHHELVSALLPHLREADGHTAAKSLFLGSLFGGDVFEWKRRHGVRGSVDALRVATPEGQFHVGEFCAMLRGAAAAFGLARPRLSRLISACGRGEGATLSYAAQDWEGMLREVKRMWGDIRRHLVFNLQHDGVAAGLSAGVDGADAARELSHIESRALCMHELAPSPPPADADAPPPADVISPSPAATSPPPATTNDGEFDDQEAEDGWAFEAGYAAEAGRHADGEGGMVVKAENMGTRPHPFDTSVLVEPAEVQWILRTDAYAPAEAGNPPAVSGASTGELERRVTSGDGTRRHARREVTRCAQAGLRVLWPNSAPRASQVREEEREQGQRCIIDAFASASTAPAIPESDRLVFNFVARPRRRGRARRAATAAAQREVRRVMAPRVRGLGGRGRRRHDPSPTEGEARRVRVWLLHGSLSGRPLAAIDGKIEIDLTIRKRTTRAQRARRERREEQLRKVRLGVEPDDSDRWQVRCLLDVARPERRRGQQLWVRVRWLGGPDGDSPWQDSSVPIQWLADSRWTECARAMEALRYANHGGGQEPPAKAARRSSRLAQLTVPDTRAGNATEHNDETKVAVVLGAHMLGQVDAGVPRTDGMATTLGRVQLGEMDAEIVDNMWEDWGLCNALDASLSCRQPWVPRGPMQGWLAQQHARAQRGT